MFVVLNLWKGDTRLNRVKDASLPLVLILNNRRVKVKPVFTFDICLVFFQCSA